MDEHASPPIMSAFGMGTRWDKAPQPLPEVFFTYICGVCQATTYAEKEFPRDLTVICNVCASQTTSRGDADPNTAVVWDFPPDLLKRLLAEAEKRGIAPENYVIGFLEWKTGQELPQIRLYNREDNRIYIVKKRDGMHR
jgi:hypothetical protein